MKFEIAKSSLVEALQAVENIVPQRVANPILGNALVQAQPDRVTLVTTNLDLTVQSSVQADVSEAGVTTLPVKRLSSVVRGLPESVIRVEVDAKDTASLRCASSYFKIMGLPSEEFPEIPKIDGKDRLSLDMGAFKTMLKETAYAASIDVARMVLNGVLLSGRRKKITLVATDGRRLALAEREVDDGVPGELDLILPLTLVQELLRTLGEEGLVTIQSAGNLVALQYANISIISKLIEGSYPNYRQVIPAQSDNRATIGREELLGAVHRVSLIRTDPAIPCKLAFERAGKLVVSMENPTVGEAKETLSIKYTGKDMLIAFNPDFLMDPLKALVSDEVFVEFTDETGPAVIKCEEPFLYVLMPVRLP